MTTNNVSDSNEQTRALVHLPKYGQEQGGSPVRRGRRSDRVSPLSRYCSGKYAQHTSVYIGEIPAIVLDITR